jgi:hypothetical protein
VGQVRRLYQANRQQGIFLKAQKIIKERRVSLSEEEMLKRLRVTLMKRGKLSPQIINEAVGLPCTAILMQRFGSLRETYRLIGYTSRKDCKYIEARQGWAAINAKLMSELAVKLQKKWARHRRSTAIA